MDEPPPPAPPSPPHKARPPTPPFLFFSLPGRAGRARLGGRGWAMAGPPAPPVRQQVGRARGSEQLSEPKELREVERCLMLDADGRRIPFKALYGEQKAIVVFVRNFLCYTCKEYVEDLAKVPKEFLQPFCSLTGYAHEMYVDPQREIYKKLGMKRGEGSNGPVQSLHVKSNTLLGSIRSMWRAMASPAFDFQGDPAQQGGALILGPGNEVHFLHLDKNRLDHVPINTVLLLAGVKTVNFTNKPQIIDI